MLSISRHAKDLIEHADSLINGNTDRGRKIALLLIDNAIEILLRMYLRYHLELSPEQVEDKSFFKLLNDSIKLKTVSSAKMYLMDIHDMRNRLYHEGSMIPPLENVKSALTFGKDLFNELNPNDKLPLPELLLPDKDTMKRIESESGRGSKEEFKLFTIAALVLRSRGFSILPIQTAFDTGVDIMGKKGNESVLIETKSNIRFETERVFDMLVEAGRAFQKRSPDEKMRLWVITRGRLSLKLVKLAEEKGIELISDYYL